MLKGRSGENIVMCTEQNGHLLCLGTSGSGKTYYIYRRIEELWKADKGEGRYVILDNSGSFTKKEMAKAEFAIDGEVFFTDLSEEQYGIFLGNADDAACGKVLSEILSDAFKISGHFQKKTLSEYCRKFYKSIQKDKPLSELSLVMEEELENNMVKDRDKRKCVCKVLEQLEVLEQCRITISKRQYSLKKGVHVLQLSGLHQNEYRIKYMNLLLRMFWHQAQHFKNGCFSTYIVDEFQNVDLPAALENFLREGRKFGVSVIIASQFISEKQKKSASVLKQAANQMLFRPADSDCHALARMTDAEHVQEWEKIFSRLQTGEAVLAGSYRVNSNQRVLHEPVIVKVQK